MEILKIEKELNEENKIEREIKTAKQILLIELIIVNMITPEKDWKALMKIIKKFTEKN